MNPLPSVSLGRSGLTVSRLSMGCWAVGGHGWGATRDQDSIQAIRRAVSQGCTFFDTADVYGLGHSESLLREALGDRRFEVAIGTKGGVRFDSSGKSCHDSSPEYLRKALDDSRRRLGLDVISLYYVHWPDAVTPVARTIEALARLREQGVIRAIGISNFNATQLKEALDVAPVDAIQIRFNLLEQQMASPLFPLCREYGVTPVLYGALADGLLSGKFSRTSTFGQDDHRSRMPDFQGEKFLRNLDVIDGIRKMELASTSTLSQIALRWVLEEVGGSVALFGAKTDVQVGENLGAFAVTMTRDDRKRIHGLLGS